MRHDFGGATNANNPAAKFVFQPSVLLFDDDADFEVLLLLFGPFGARFGLATFDWFDQHLLFEFPGFFPNRRRIISRVHHVALPLDTVFADFHERDGDWGIVYAGAGQDETDGNTALGRNIPMKLMPAPLLFMALAGSLDAEARFPWQFGEHGIEGHVMLALDAAPACEEFGPKVGAGGFTFLSIRAERAAGTVLGFRFGFRFAARLRFGFPRWRGLAVLGQMFAGFAKPISRLKTRRIE